MKKSADRDPDRTCATGSGPKARRILRLYYWYEHPPANRCERRELLLTRRESMRRLRREHRETRHFLRKAVPVLAAFALLLLVLSDLSYLLYVLCGFAALLGLIVLLRRLLARHMPPTDGGDASQKTSWRGRGR